MSAATADTFMHGVQAGELLGVDANSIAIDPADPDTAYAVSRVGVFKTVNGGRHWFLAGLDGLRVPVIAVDGNDSAIVYAGTFGAGIYKSSDHGGTWSATNQGLGNLTILTLAIDPSIPNTIYAGTGGGGVFKSVDAAGSWQAVNSGLTNPAILSVRVDPSDSATLYASTSGGGVFKSSDAGITWSAVNTGITTLVVARSRWTAKILEQFSLPRAASIRLSREEFIAAEMAARTGKA